MCWLAVVMRQATAVSFLALFTRFMDCRMRPGTVVTGELSLAGRMLRIDSLNAKLDGCRSWGVKRVVVPKVSNRQAQTDEVARPPPSYA